MDLVGKQIGNYVAKAELGRGGMGTVYLAEHPIIGRKVAVKVLHEELAINEQMVQRLWLEAKSASEIDSEHIVEVVDFGRLRLGTAGGEPRETVYLTMELLTGISLADQFWKEGITFREAVDVARQICRALEASHARGIIHRDLKPENIFLTEKGGRKNFVKVLDFGIAKLLANPYTRTRTGVLLGTPAYMSPEQCRGSGEVDHRSDIYSLGVMLYELTSGSLPFAAKGFGDVLVAQMTRRPEPPSSYNARIPSTLEGIILCALEKKPEDRFQSMAAMGAALGSVAADLERSVAEGQVRGNTKADMTTAREGQPDADNSSTLVDPPSATDAFKIKPIERDLHGLETQLKGEELHHRRTQIKDAIHEQTTMLKDPAGTGAPPAKPVAVGPGGTEVLPQPASDQPTLAEPAAQVPVGSKTTLKEEPATAQARAELNQRLKGISLRQALGSTGAVRQLEIELDKKGAPKPVAASFAEPAHIERTDVVRKLPNDNDDDDAFIATTRRAAQLRMMIVGGVVLLAALGLLLALR